VKGFVEIPAAFLRAIATGPQAGEAGGVENTPVLYFHPNRAIRACFWLRLKWIWALIRRHGVARGSACDFGGGGGVLLPTLAGHFERVVCVDRKLAEARAVVEHYGLSAVELVDEDIGTSGREEAFDCIVAADVLEHFPDLAVPVGVLARWLRPGGHLLTSPPTENLTYVLLRALFRVTKPVDHYHTAAEVERCLAAAGFERLETWHVPLRLRVLPLFRITIWRGPASAG